MSAERAEKVPSLTLMPRRFVHHVLNFFVGLGIGLSPFLGSRNVPFFRSLISVMPFQIASKLITLSAFIMGLIVVAVQFYSAERISRPLLRKLFGIAFAALAVGFVLFYFLRNEYTFDVERGKSGKQVTVLVSSSPRRDCPCPNVEQDPEGCIQRLSFSAAAIARCWDHREIRRRGGLLGLSYLVLTGGVGVLIGFLLLQEEIRREAKKKARKPTRKGKPTGTRRKKTSAAKGTTKDSEQPSEPHPETEGRAPESEVSP